MKDDFPNASQIILNNTYVDDIVNSVQNTSSALKVVDQIEHDIKRGGFQIKHWIYTAEDENNC